MGTKGVHPVLTEKQTVTSMGITDLRKTPRRFARDAELFVMAMRTRSSTLKMQELEGVEESGRDLANAERRVAHIAMARFDFSSYSA